MSVFLQARSHFPSLFLLFPLYIALIFLPSSCVPYRTCTKDFVCQEQEIREYEDCDELCIACIESRELQAANHWAYKIVPRHRCQIYWFDLPHWLSWALLGNDDDGLFGEAPSAQYKLECCPNTNLALNWALRNPLHNFTFYVIGSANCHNDALTILKLSCPSTEILCYRHTAKTVFADKDSSFYLALHKLKPFISIRLKHSNSRRTDFYFGWRERGNFGIKFQPLKSCQ
jgi:hypothetical protein